jgi:hypothetical protein
VSADDFPDKEDMREGKQKRAARALAMLAASRLAYTCPSESHYVVTDRRGAQWDYWPSTGKYHARKKGAPYEDGGAFRFLLACGLPRDEIELCRAGVPLPEPVPPSNAEEKLNAHVAQHAPLVVAYNARMSAYAVRAYRIAGFIVLGAPD